MKLTGKVALITGAGRGLGTGFAVALAREGALVAVNALHHKGVDETVREIEGSGGKALAVIGDVSQKREVERIVADIIKVWGTVDILINNAGVNPFILPAELIEEEGWDQVVDVNLKGPFLCCQAVFAPMKDQGGGRIVNISSQAALLGEQGMLPYCVSKAGILSLTRVLAYEWSRYGISVNAVAPGFVAAGMNEPLMRNTELVNTLAQRVPMKRFADSKEVVSVIVFLCSDEARYINGETIVVDGGMSGYPINPLIDLLGRR